MERRLGRWTTVLGVIGALVLAGAIYQASRAPSTADARTTDIQLEEAVKATQTPVGLMSPEAWAEREQLLRTDEQAQAYAEDYTTLIRAILPLPDPATFYQNQTLAKVSLVRGVGKASVWEARYNVEVGSNETTFTTVYPSVTRFGPGLTPADKPPSGTEDVFAFANLGYFTTDQRVSFLSYWKAERLKDLHMVARLDREFPGAAWYEDTQFRASLIEAGKKAGLGPEDLAYYFLDHQKVGTLIGFDAKTKTWSELKVKPYPYAKWYAHATAVAAAEQAAHAAAVAKLIPPAKRKAKAAKAAKKATARPTAGTTPRATPSAAAPAGQPAPSSSTAQAGPSAQQPSTTGGAAQPASGQQPVEVGGTIPATGTPWYNLLLIGIALLIFGAAGFLRFARPRHD